MVFALFADASRRSMLRVAEPPAANGPSSPGPVLPLDLEMLQRELKFLPVFRAGIAGVSLRASADRIEILFEGEELYSSNRAELERVWLESLSQIGELVYLGLEPTLELEIIGFEDPGSKSGEGLGVRRAEAVLDFFRNHLQEQKTRRVRISSGGSPPRGPRLELRVVRRGL